MTTILSIVFCASLYLPFFIYLHRVSLAYFMVLWDGRGITDSVLIMHCSYSHVDFEGECKIFWGVAVSSLLQNIATLAYLVSLRYTFLSPVLSFRSTVQNLRETYTFIWKLVQTYCPSSKRPFFFKMQQYQKYICCLLCGTSESKLLVIILKIFKTVKMIVIEGILILNGKYAHF